MLGLLISILGMVGGAWFMAALALDRYGQRRRPRGRYDAIVVAGCAVRPDGSPSAALRRRAERAARLHAAGWAPVIVLTGGIGHFPPSEAEVAASVCRELGVDAGALLLEERSTSTLLNARFAHQVLVHHGLNARRILVVSDAYHIFRCERIFRRHFDEADGSGVCGPLGARLRMSLREVAALVAYALRPPPARS